VAWFTPDFGLHFRGVEAAISISREAGALTVYRSTQTGHAGDAAKMQHEAPLELYEVQTSTDEPYSFDWQMFEEINLRTYSQLKEDEIIFLDIYYLTKLRADSHPQMDGAQDSFYYCSPGPLDAWAELLAASLRLLEKISQGH
jgi:hypothetical protein